MTQKRASKKPLSHIFPIAKLPGIFPQVTPPKSLKSFWPNYRLSIAIGLTAVSLARICCTAAHISVMSTWEPGALIVRGVAVQ